MAGCGGRGAGFRPGEVKIYQNGRSLLVARYSASDFSICKVGGMSRENPVYLGLAVRYTVVSGVKGVSRMPEVGVTELKRRASEIVRQVRQDHARFVITYRGRPAAVLLPLPEGGEPGAEAAGDSWDELVRLGREVGQGWTAGKSGGDLLAETRR